MAKIFISYKRNVDLDASMAADLYEALCGEHEVFIDTKLQVGENWADRIQNALKVSDYFIALLSENSVNSEMVIAEIETAYHLNKSQGNPKTLPVRLNFTTPLVYPLSAYLNSLQWAIWNKHADTPKLISELKKAISGGNLPVDEVQHAGIVTAPTEEIPSAFATPFKLDSPEGTMTPQSPFYVEREGDAVAMQALDRSGVTITIKAPRQMGKSSLLNRIMSEGGRRGLKSAYIDFQLIEKSALDNPDVFYRQFCNLLNYEFNVEDHTESFWGVQLGNPQKTTNYILKHLLQETQGTPLLLAMDEVERMFSSPFRSDFFSMLRSWHNNRARGGDWTRFNLALVTSTEPYQFIDDLNQSPFNVGEVIELNDFSQAQVVDLNQRHGKPLMPNQVGQLHKLLGGHPYLTRKALFLIASRRATFDELLEKSCEDDGPFGDHLRNHTYRMSGQEKLQSGFLQVINHQRCTDKHVFFQLHGAGLVKRAGNEVLPRNELYTCYFGEQLNG
jgi:hypothetical protein